jgi:hypothetical protein
LKLINEIISRRKMGGVFGKSKKPVSRVTEQDKAVLVSVKHIYLSLSRLFYKINIFSYSN